MKKQNNHPAGAKGPGTNQQETNMTNITDHEELDGFSNDELLTFYCNAAKTHDNAIGHTKSHNNGVQAKLYAAELSARGEFVPEYYEAAGNGIFNGPGSR